MKAVMIDGMQPRCATVWDCQGTTTVRLLAGQPGLGDVLPRARRQ
jgi:hypothetical protein